MSRSAPVTPPPAEIDLGVVARHITADTLAKIVNNTFPIRKLYKIDRTRVGQVVEQVGTEMEPVVQERLKSVLEKVGKSKAKYKDLYSILRSWIVFVQLKEIFEPGMGIASTGHSNKLLRLGMRHPNRFPTLLNNHINVVKERLNAGASFPRIKIIGVDTNARCSCNYPAVRGAIAYLDPKIAYYQHRQGAIPGGVESHQDTHCRITSTLPRRTPHHEVLAQPSVNSVFSMYGLVLS